MIAIRYALFILIDIGVLGSLSWLIYMTLFAPARFAVFDRPRKEGEHLNMFLSGAFYLICAIGFGVFIYHGSAYLFSWMPQSWGGYYEDDEFETYQHGLAFGISCYGTIFILWGLTQSAQKREELERENKALRNAIDRGR